MPFTTFDVNIFGTTHDDLDGSNTNGSSREFVIHVLQVECNQAITNFDMFIEFYAFPFNLSWFTGANFPTIDNMFLNGRPQVMHLDTMTPNSPVALYPTCSTSPALPCPSPIDMRLFSMAFQVPVTGSLTGYDEDYTDMYDDLNVAKLPVNITIIADGCRYSSEMGTTINIYRDYFGSGNGALFGGDTDIYPIGFNEKITIS